MGFGIGVTLLLSTLWAGCGGSGVSPWKAPTARDQHDDPRSVRPGHCQADLHVWSPLTEAESKALAQTAAAREGDAHALLGLALVASGDKRDTASYAAYQAKIDQFVAAERPKVLAQADDWHRGYELHRAMHHTFFLAKTQGLDNYALNQSKVTGIFATNHYNCISSAMLFTVLGRAFDMPVRGVAVPTHAFVEYGPPGGKILEIETTSQTGFDLVHDARFYREAAAEWSSSRGLAPVTLEEYKNRTILAPYQLMALGMYNQAGLEQGDAQLRLVETSTLVDPDAAAAQTLRMALYVNEANALREAKAAHTTAAFLQCVAPAIDQTALKRAADLETMQSVTWARWYRADALAVIGRGEEAAAIAETGLDGLNPGFKDYTALRENFLTVLEDRMLVLMDQKQFEVASAVLGKHLDACRTSQVCSQNLEAVYQNWSADRQNAGDWYGARKALTSCTQALPQSAVCTNLLKDLESRHRF